MSFMIEVYYKLPEDKTKELQIEELVKHYGGEITFREVPEENSIMKAICLTIEFSTLESAEIACQALRDSKEHVEGPGRYR